MTTAPMSNLIKRFQFGREAQRVLGLGFVRVCIAFSIIFLGFFIIVIFIKSGSVLSLNFLIDKPKMGMSAGGIFPAIVGTLYLTVLSVVFALPLGILAAIYLNEYGKPVWLISIVRLAINTLAGVPSIVFGLFGLAIFVNTFHFGVSILSGSLTLAILILPIIINASEEALRAVPKDFREAAYSLGCTKREAILRVVLPTALPSILTGAILSVGRAAGETAPIIFTAAAFYIRKLPTSVFDECMALPYHIYALMTEGTSSKQPSIAYGTAVVLLFLVLGINVFAIVIRYRMRRNKKW